MATFLEPWSFTEENSHGVLTQKSMSDYGYDDDSSAIIVTATVYTVPDPGDVIRFGVRSTIDGGSTYRWLWFVDIDDTFDIDEAIVSPVIPLAQDPTNSTIATETTLAGADVPITFQVTRLGEVPAFSPVAEVTTVSGLNTSNFPETGGYVVVITLDAAPDPGDSVRVGFWVSLTENDPRFWAWSVVLDDTVDPDVGFVSPVIPVGDSIWDSLLSDADISGAGVAWHWQMTKVG